MPSINPTLVEFEELATKQSKFEAETRKEISALDAFSHDNLERRIKALEEGSSPPVNPPIKPPIDPIEPPDIKTPPTGPVARTLYFRSLPPDSERSIDRILEPGSIHDLWLSIRDGQTIGLRTGGTYTHNSPWMPRSDNITITAVGDRDKPLPILLNKHRNNGSIGIRGKRPTVELIHIQAPNGGGGLRFHETSDSILRYCLASRVGKEGSPGLSNSGISFITSNSLPGRHVWSHIEAFEIAEDLMQSLRGDEQCEMDASNIYAHRCYEDGIDNKSWKKLIVRDFWAVNCGSKGLVCHGTSGSVYMERFRIINTTLNDGIYIDGKGNTLRGPWTFKDGEIEGCKQAAVIFKDAVGIAKFANVVRSGNGNDQIVQGRGTNISIQDI